MMTEHVAKSIILPSLYSCCYIETRKCPFWCSNRQKKDVIFLAHYAWFHWMIMISIYKYIENLQLLKFFITVKFQYVPYSYHIDLIFVWYFLNGVIICLIDKAFSHHEQWKHFNRLRPPWALNPTINIHISSSA